MRSASCRIPLDSFRPEAKLHQDSSGEFVCAPCDPARPLSLDTPAGTHHPTEDQDRPVADEGTARMPFDELVSRVERGDDVAFEDLYRHWRNQVRDFLRTLLREELVDGVHQQTWVEVWHALRMGRFQRDRGEFAAFLFGIARRVARQQLRKRTQPNGMQVPLDSAAEELDPTRGIQYRAQLDALRSCIQEALDERARQVIELAHFQEKTEREISEILGMPRSTVHDWKVSALHRLRRCLESKGFRDADLQELLEPAPDLRKLDSCLQPPDLIRPANRLALQPARHLEGCRTCQKARTGAARGSLAPVWPLRLRSLAAALILLAIALSARHALRGGPGYPQALEELASASSLLPPEPFAPGAFDRFVLQDLLERSSDRASIFIVRPRASITESRPSILVRLDAAPLRPVPVEVTLLTTSGRELLQITRSASAQELVLPLEELEALAPDEYVIIVSRHDTGEQVSARFRVVDPAQVERLLQDVPRTANEPLDQHLRVAALLDQGLAELALARLSSGPATTTSPARQALHALLEARCLALLGRTTEATDLRELWSREAAVARTAE